jgi:hypothetical protein
MFFSGLRGLDQNRTIDEAAHETPFHAHSCLQGNPFRHVL